MCAQSKSVGLNFYIEQKISPVHQDLTNLERHFQVRGSLYTKLGLPSKFITDKSILEVGAGSGHNSLYTASQSPKFYHICEPNPVAVKDIVELFSNLNIPHTQPDIFCEKLEEYFCETKYDIVICEGWLGGMTDYERAMMGKLSGFVALGGLLIMTFLPPIGGLSSFLRRILAYRTINECDSFTDKTNKLIAAYGTHLSTLPHLSRSHEHWVQDCILNPHIYVGPLSPSICMNIIGDQFELYNSVPTFYSDWRWYKSLFGPEKNYNQRFIEQLDALSHNLLDYRYDASYRNPKENQELEHLCLALIEISKAYDTKGYDDYQIYISPILKKISENLTTIPSQETKIGFAEVLDLLSQKNISTDDIKNMKYFSGLFGRGQCYLSFIRQESATS